MSESNPFLATPGSWCIAALAVSIATYNVVRAGLAFHYLKQRTYRTFANTAAKMFMFLWVVGYNYPDSQRPSIHYQNIQYFNTMTYCFSLGIEAVISLVMLRTFPKIRESRKHRMSSAVTFSFGGLIIIYVLFAMCITSPTSFWVKIGTTVLSGWAAVMWSLLTATTISLLVQHKHSLRPQTLISRSDFASQSSVNSASKPDQPELPSSPKRQSEEKDLLDIERTLRNIKVSATVFTVMIMAVAGAYIKFSSSGIPEVYAALTVLIACCSSFVTYLRGIGRKIFAASKKKPSASTAKAGLAKIASMLRISSRNFPVDFPSEPMTKASTKASGVLKSQSSANISR